MHLVENDINLRRTLWKGEISQSRISTNSRGVAILINNTFEYHIIETKTDTDGKMLCLKLQINHMSVSLINVYGPNHDEPIFFHCVEDMINTSDQDYVVLCGDLNITLNPALDNFNYLRLNNKRAQNALKNMINECSLTDAYRYFYSRKWYTWYKKNPIKQARLDYFIVSSSLMDIISDIDIKAGCRTDHSLLMMSLLVSSFTRGPGLWKFNTMLLKDKDYPSLVRTWIKDEKRKYAVPLYDLDTFESLSDDYIYLTINYNSFLEMLLLQIRVETFKYATIKKKKRN